MCGIAGCFEFPGAPSNIERIHAMTATLRHRGPDGGDVWLDAKARLALGHRRLSIIDLSEAGRQPMASSCGRFVITYNGEIYNADDLRHDLSAAGRSFRGHSDTEVIIEGCAVWGIEQTIDRLIGMFAIGVWDREKGQLTLIRDRLGIKPLYWGFQKGLFLFASELKAFRAAPDFDAEINRNAVASFLRYNYIPAPLSIYNQVRKLEPGTLLTIGPEGNPEAKAYWTLAEAVSAGKADLFSGSDSEAIDELESLLKDAVHRRMISDVPLGAFLSGGIDSSTVVALMQSCSANPVKTFSIGFDESGYNEAHHAGRVARHLGTDHTELYVTPRQTMDVIPSLATMYDEPFADSSQIPTHLVSALTKQHVTVSLSGDGGDELFAGYNRYIQAKTLMRYFWAMPAGLRRSLAHLMMRVPVGIWNAVLQRLPVVSRYPLPGDKIHKLADVLMEDREEFYPRLVTHWAEPSALVPGGVEDVISQWKGSLNVSDDFTERMQYADTLTYLPDDILTKVDRASMAASLEARVPILDHRVVEFAWRLPQHFKVRDGESKWILRQVLYRYLPKDLIDRPKMGFGVPIDQWLRGPLKDWAENLLAERNLNKFGLVEPGPVRDKWQEHLSGQRNWQYLLWDILMLQAWCEEWM